MPVLPEEVAAARFPRRLRGYTPTRVDGFLREVAEDYAAAITRIAHTAEHRSASEARVQELLAQLGAAVESARRDAEHARQNADADVEAMRSRAEQAAAAITRQAEDAAAALMRRAEELRDAAQRDADAARERLAAADRRAQEIEDAARARWDALRAETEGRFDEVHAAERRLAERSKVAHDALSALRSKVALLEQVEQVEHQLSTLSATFDAGAARSADGEAGNSHNAGNGHRDP